MVGFGRVLAEPGWLAFHMALNMRQWWSGKFCALRYTLLKEAVGNVLPDFAGLQQADAQEFLQQLLLRTNEQLHRAPGMSTDKGVTKGQSVEAEAAIVWANYQANNRSIVTQLFCSPIVKLLSPACGHPVSAIPCVWCSSFD